VTTSELKDLVATHDRDHHYKSVDSYWSNWVKQAALTSFPGVSYQGRGRGYVYTPDGNQDA